MKKIVLASGSPRRRELLSMLDVNFSIAESYHVDEVYPSSLASHDVPIFLAELKNTAYPAEIIPNEIILTADTVVILDGQIIGKPQNEADAIDILSRLSGNRHTVVTGVTLRSSDKQHSFSVESDVYFRELTQQQIEYYVQKYKPMDKAGAYGVQEWIGMVAIERIEGSFYNVMGLPTSRLMVELAAF